MMKRIPLICLTLLVMALHAMAQSTEIQCLSGTGSDHTVNWQFFCTGGSNAGKWTTIPVPSCWELQGFGKYDYGFAKDSIRGKEQGLYKYNFQVPAAWKGKKVNIVFEGVMTDATVKVNGVSAGPVHQGAFYAFKYDISSLLQYGQSKNLLEVTVAKHSANESVNAAERRADFWIFGGIFRPVFLEALPAQHIEMVKVNATAEGVLHADVQLQTSTATQVTMQLYDKALRKVGPLQTKTVNGTSLQLDATYEHIELWSAESPALYTAEFTLLYNNKVIHTIRQRIGFRTVVLRQRNGIYVNGVKMKFKGVNRHSFRPESGRTTSKAISIADVLLIKEMNMNAVRMSHYPPDAHFLEACDSLGLYVMDEQAGWHGNYDTETGTGLVKEMITHDVNHPSIVIWANGNEGGHNKALDHLFPELDPQQRPVVHPWQLFNGIETQHYREYDYGIANYEHGKEIVMPTEFLHGQFDGGHGAGLEDYWEKMWHNPLSAGGFLWDFADQGVVRKDLHDSLDTDHHRGADGIVGPHHEKEGSFFTIKEVWCPVYMERREITPAFDGILHIENRYAFTNLHQCSFSATLAGSDMKLRDSFAIAAPDVAPFEKGRLQLQLPANWSSYDVLYVTARDKEQRELFTWSFPIVNPAQVTHRSIDTLGNGEVFFKEADSLWTVSTKNIELTFSKNKGLLKNVRSNGQTIPFNNGPIIQEGENNFAGFTHHYEEKNLVISSTFDRKQSYNTLQWTIYPSGIVKMTVRYFPDAYFTSLAGLNFSFPASDMVSVDYMGDGPYRVWKNRLKGTRFGIWHKDYNDTETGESWNYPEFKGYYANMYWCGFKTRQQYFRVYTENESLFLRLFTPAWKTDQWHNYEPIFPSGDISFLQGISSIGTKTQRNETTGPMGQKNIFYDYEKEPERALQILLYFDFSGK
ncbi:glycoside hydrolase family 2 protein [Chitinophaga pinensis]|uniref:beta-galactosidase n=1 Tax=Chitinophaga pinensis (strain ATCC 43595 / DSM 2588 / LMG 13176 / NBRC 15968 / NCIMB 11800 / UQM 2034) TaxID=485918 RepID=A0A979GQM3_CHIPD|nr:glycoside hydrolase family 2 [Chitinophaga pinensis]ACU60213.1 glycoside hydrolase family 2 sugar binding [Chitinophaga pinensis DSM 2588]